MSFENGGREATKSSILTELEGADRPYLAAVAALMLRMQVMSGELDEQVVRAFAQVNPGRSDRAAMQGAAMSFSAQSRMEVRAIGSLAPGGADTGAVQGWRRAFSGSSEAQYDPQLLPEIAEELFYGSGEPWSLLVRTSYGGRLPRPLIVNSLSGSDALIYDPANSSEGWPTMYTMSVDELAGRAALYASFGVLAVRPLEPESQGVRILPTM